MNTIVLIRILSIVFQSKTTWIKKSPSLIKQESSLLSLPNEVRIKVEYKKESQQFSLYEYVIYHE